MPKYKLLTSLQDENNKLHEIGDTISMSKEKAQPLIANGTIAELDIAEFEGEASPSNLAAELSAELDDDELEDLTMP